LTPRICGTTVALALHPKDAPTDKKSISRPVAVLAALAGLMLGAPAAAEAQLEVDYECTPAPLDCSGWYQSKVSITWTVLPAPPTSTVLAGCQNKTLTSDTPGSTEFCSARLGAGKSTEEVTITIDQTPPVVTRGQPARGADFNGWYNRPVAVAFSGSDLTSGIASCTSPTFGGPDGGAAFVFGTCMDNAGNVSSPFGYGLSYDANAPPLSDLEAAAGDRRVTVSWETSGDTKSVQVVRSPGLGSEQASVVFNGPGRKFHDDRVANGRRYVYEVNLTDAAGNAADETVASVPHPHLVSPARLKAFTPGKPPVLRWTPVRRATYYNVQLFRGGRKILSAWPTDASYRMKTRWRYLGKRRRLVPGRYRWVVWPGYGTRSKSNYGKRLGPKTFRVSR
jgi:hypothetical protein